jgi:hypothetical protein
MDNQSCNRGYKIFPSSFCTEAVVDPAIAGQQQPSINIGPITQEQWVNDISEPLQRAIDYCLHKGIGNLQLRPNTYPLSKPLHIASGKLTISGTGLGLATSRDPCVVPVLKLSPLNHLGQSVMTPPKAAIMVAATNTGLSTGVLDDTKLIGNVSIHGIAVESVGQTTTKALVHFRNAFACVVERCRIGGSPTPGGIAADFTHTDMANAHQGVGLMFSRNRVTTNPTAISWLNHVRFNTISWCNGKGLVMGCSDSWINENYVDHTSGCLEIDFSGNKWTHNHIDQTRGIGDETGISFIEPDSADTPRRGSSVVANNTLDIHGTAIALSQFSEDTIIVGNTFRASRNTYIALNRAKYISITGNVLRRSNTAGFKPITHIGIPVSLAITGNTLRNALDPALLPFATGNTQ